MLGFIKYNVSYKSKFVIMKLYNAYVRPHLEYCQQACIYINKSDINLLESVQRRMTKIIPSISNLPYEQRLKELNMFTLERRFIREDLIQVFKIIHKIDNIDFNLFFNLNESVTRGHKYSLQLKPFNNNVRKFSFSQRTVNRWNRLPANVVESPTIDTFKRRLDSFMKNWDERDYVTDRELFSCYHHI